MGQAFPCGRCLPCLFNRRRIWTHRIMLEAVQYSDNTFVTLTYSDEELPRTTSSLPTLIPEHTQLWLKRLRKAIAPLKLRFYLSGEYGDETERPHYHAALFNFPNCSRGQTGFGQVSANWSRCCASCRLVGTTWGKGNIYLGVLETASAQYVAGYVTKKLTRSDHFWLNGRHPEFSRMSNRPGIGADALHEVADALLRLDKLDALTDVPVSLRHGSRELPLGRYLRRRLRKLIGRDENTPEAVLKSYQEEMQPVRQAAFDASTSFKKAILEDAAGQIANFHSRRRLYHRKGKL